MHADGAAIVWHVDVSNPSLVEPPMQQRLLLRAHSRSAVAAVLTTPWGSLWTAGSSGSLRWWPTAMTSAMAAPHTTALDWSALPQCELRRATGERAHGMTAALCLTSGGQVPPHPPPPSQPPFLRLSSPSLFVAIPALGVVLITLTYPTPPGLPRVLPPKCIRLWDMLPQYCARSAHQSVAARAFADAVLPRRCTYAVSIRDRVPAPLQVVVAASRTRATLWDAFSGRFLGVLAINSTPLDTPSLIDPGAGVRMAPHTGRAASSPEGPLPALGASADEMLPGEEAAKLAHRLNSVAMTTHSIAKKCASRPLPGGIPFVVRRGRADAQR